VGYPSALVVTPRVSLHWSGGEARLMLAAVVAPDQTAAQAAAPTLACLRLYEDTGEGTRGSTRAAAASEMEPAVLLGEFPAAAIWKRSVEETAQAVRHGRLQKAVLARGITIRGARLDPAAALHRLRAEYPDCTIFAIGRGDRCFLGASPERLVRVRDGEVAVSALAGSAPRGRTEAADRALGLRLLRSEKERLEHRLVVDVLRSALAGVSNALSPETVPQLLTIRNTHHLHTPLHAVLRDKRSVFDLIARLHPTPAVGGVPRAAALAWIRQHEGWDRGWYAGPVGWVGAGGDGEAAVAIRSGLITGGHAYLFAGCGIVADSNPRREFAESNWKLRPLLSALAVTPSRPARGARTAAVPAPRPA